MNKSHFLFFIITIFSCTTRPNTPWTIVFDLPNTLVEPDKIKFFKDVIGVSGITYALWDWQNPLELQELMFKTLDTLGLQKQDDSLIVRDPGNRPLPQIFCDILNGKNTLRNAASQIQQQIKILGTRHYFANTRQQELIANIVNAIFDPLQVAKHVVPVKSAVLFVKECAKQCGTKNLYILANWEKVSFIELFGTGQEKMQHAKPLFQYFTPDNIFISGISKTLLPNSDAFKPLLAKGINPARCVYISGMPYHVLAARKMGMSGILVQDLNFDAVNEGMKTLGIWA